MSTVPTPASGQGHGHGFQPAHRNTRISNGLLGVIFFLCTEVALFGSLFFAYLYLRRSEPNWPPHGFDHLDVTLGAANTAILVISGFWCHYADTAIAKGKQGRFLLLLGLTIIFGATFLGIQAHEYIDLQTAINKDIFGATFFTLTGLHGAHVTLGVLALIVIFVLGLRRRWGPNNHFAVHGVTLYWHFVDVVWVLLFALFYLV